MNDSQAEQSVIGVVGLGNVGLPLAIELGKKYKVIGYDLDTTRTQSLNKGIDNRNNNTSNFKVSNSLLFTSDKNKLHQCNVYIVSVPTYFKADRTPDISALSEASNLIALMLKKNDLVIYESTVYPGCTESVCVPILEKHSNLKLNVDFFVGYSPERINTADSEHTLVNTIKITSGSNSVTACKVDEFYKSIVSAGTHPVASIKIAEAAKLLENAQRDLNIAFMNEVAKVFTSNDISFNEIWNACNTKWNFLKFTPGLVGGECLPLATNYINYLSDGGSNLLNVVRSVNDTFPLTLSEILINKLKQQFIDLREVNILILGIAYKANSFDEKGSLIPHLIAALKANQFQVDEFDPVVKQNDTTLASLSNGRKYHLIVKCVKHQVFEDLNLLPMKHEKGLIFDINSFNFL